ncbi:unnamed protein product [Urochloa humidicola]
MEMRRKTTVVLYPGVGVGHLSPMLELSKALLRHGGGAIDVAVVLVESPFGDPGFTAAVARARASHTSVSFHVLPTPPPLPPASGADADDHPIVGLLRYLRATNAPLRDLLHSLYSASRPAHALVLDMFCAHALDVAAELAVPAYFFFATGASALAVFLALPSVRSSAGAAFRELGDTVLPFAGVPPLKASELPPGITGDGALCKASLRLAARVPEARGILVNSFEALEPRAVQALRDGLCVHGHPTPPIYCVGPLVSPGAGAGAGEEEHECLRWMDAQPERSVVFLCFGSMGVLPRRQLADIAAGLESSGHQFLWVVRSPPGGGGGGGGGSPVLDPADEPLDELLPAGFMERTKDRGFVVKSWAPQVDVLRLRHRAAGAFVTHCGWNSTMEAVAAGIPMLCWPLYAEQGLNKVFIVEEMRLGVEMAMDGEGFVAAEEVEKKVRWVMGDSDGARELSERAAKARVKAAEALADGGLVTGSFR